VNWTPEFTTAAATVVIAAFTVVLAGGGSVQAYLTRQAINIARDELISAHPPKLAVRYIHLTCGNEHIEVDFTVENTGGSRATVTQSMIGLCIYGGPLPCPPEYHKFGRNVLDKTKFSVGGVQSFTVSSDLESAANLPWYDLHFIGWQNTWMRLEAFALCVSVANISQKYVALSKLMIPNMNQTTIPRIATTRRSHLKHERWFLSSAG
jgi:hypothetical protein